MRKGLLGRKLTHSFSKIIHEDLMDYEYELIELEADELDGFFEKKDFDALNVTVPYKQAVMKYMDHIDEKCRIINATNTIVNRNGSLYCYNTDYYGFRYMLEKHGVDLNGKKVCLLGNGGAAQAIKAVIADYDVRETVICKKRESSETITYDTLYRDHRDIDVLINTSYVGMYPNNYDKLIELDGFGNLEWVIDIIYNPLKTGMLVDAENRGINTINGLEMLVAQAVYAMEYFQDIEIDKGIIDEYYRRLTGDKINIVLIGMPSSGKSTIAGKLSEKTGREVIDTDELTEAGIGMAISDYFGQYGEASFRAEEKKSVREASKANGHIIATGGGVILDRENIDALKQNGLIVYIRRDVDKLLATEDRPLSTDNEAIRKLYDSRYRLYESYADITVENNGDIEDAVNEIIEMTEGKLK